jgi:gliding motility-associated-like protein
VAAPFATTVYTVSVESADGCVATDTVLIVVRDPADGGFVFPNCITPNGDGANDTWILDVIQLFDNHEVILINRWGSEVFRSTDYQNDFDGTWEGGELPAGTYYYLIRLNTDQIYKGPFVIIRE